MKKKKGGIMGLFLAFVMLLSFAPVTAWADENVRTKETETSVENIEVSEVNIVVTGYEVGKTVGDAVISTDTQGIELCSPSGYWSDNNGKISDTAKFEAEKKYYNYVSIKAKDGYVLDDFLTIKYNTSVNGDGNCDQIVNGWKNYGYVDGEWTDAEGYYTLRFFMDPIPSESENNITELAVTLTGFEVGKNVADAAVTTTNPNVTISDVKFIIENGKDNPEATGTFEAGISYRLAFNVMPAEGYKLFLTNAKDKVTINGTPANYVTSLAESTGGAYISSKLMKLDAAAIIPAAPTGLVGVEPFEKGGNDGKITGTTVNMEYSTDPTFATVTDCGNGETTGLTAGTYYVRVKADPEGNYGAGAAAVVVVNEGVERVTVTFDSNGGSKVDSRRIEKGTAVIQPKNPKRSGYSFKGWYSDEELRTKYDFSQPVNEDITLYARWSRSGRGSSSLSSSATNYRVIIEDTDNGIVESDKETASKNSIVTITVKPDKYYEIRGVKVVDNNGNEIKLKDKGDGTYTFTMPASKVYVNASFKEIEKGSVIRMTIGDIEMSANDRVFYNDVAPVIVDNRTMVPIRVITELLGGTADWNEETKEVTLTIDGKVIRMTVGVVLEKYGVAPVIINGRTYVPIRFVADELGAETSWDEATKTVTIYTANK